MNDNRLKAALLPLYLELYDTSFPEIRPGIDRFLREVTFRLESNGITVVKLPVCRMKKEFDQAVNKAETEDADAIITLHLAYSPSLESIEALTRTELPVIIMDTTPSYSFGPQQSPDEIMYNHGIHGVQDLCNLLTRNHKYFLIEAGHMDHSDIIERITRHVISAKMVSVMKKGRTGRIGDSFSGMGDFVVEPMALKATTGTSIVQAEPKDIAEYLPDENDPMIEEEMKKDALRFDTYDIDPVLHRLSIKNGLALRKWIEYERLTAFTINFSNITPESGLSVMPFLEISKLLAKGIGYAGEGDVLTASFTGALFSVFRDVTFTEMFCPDWENNSIFLSHMGEMNLNLSANKPKLTVIPWKFSSATAPVIATACYKEGRAVLANLAPSGDHSYSLILAPVTLLPEGTKTRFSNHIRGWMKPDIPLPDFLKNFSQLAGTHHSALVYNGNPEIILDFGKMMGWKVYLLQ